ncbi:MAG TPA: zf-TFIIB domain-containing protein [Capillimicrobium sp.]|nr:zf-TFIIB domain-containing protein [Capillimicrobium sp.]
MNCPKCSAEMRTYERNGVHVDQCTDCRGLFLDRGELEHLVEAESAFYRGGPPEPRFEEHRGYGEYTFQGKPYKKRKRHFLEELFD